VIKTLQGHSGAGMATVPKDKRGGPTPMEDGSEKEKLETEPLKFLGSMRERAAIDIQAYPERAPWVWGHHILAVVKFKRGTKPKEVKNILRSFRAPEELRGIKYGEDSPKRKPIKVIDHSPLIIGKTGNMKKVAPLYPMRVVAHLQEVSGVDQDEAIIEIAAHNVSLGAVGASAMNMTLARERGYIGA
jgi:aspartate-semialdehyde dehydrogenase